MDKFAECGFDVWTMDFEGYGRSGMGTGNSDIATQDGRRDYPAAEVILRETGQSRFHLMGESSGALRAGVFAMSHPEHVERLVLVSFTYTGEGSPTLSKALPAGGLLSHPQPPSTRPGNDPQHFHSRQARHLGPGGR